MKYRVHLYKYTSSIFVGDEYRIIEAYSAADIQPMIDVEAKNNYYARIEVRRIEVVDSDKTPAPPANEQLTREILLRIAESLDRVANALEREKTGVTVNQAEWVYSHCLKPVYICYSYCTHCGTHRGATK